MLAAPAVACVVPLATHTTNSPWCPQGVMSHDRLSSADSAVHIMWLGVGLQKELNHFTTLALPTLNQDYKHWQTLANIMWTNWILLFHECLFLSTRGTRQAELKAPTIGFTAIASRSAVCSWAVGCPNVGLQLSTPACAVHLSPCMLQNHSKWCLLWANSASPTLKKHIAANNSWLVLFQSLRTCHVSTMECRYDFEFYGGQWCETHPSSWSNTPRSRASRTGHTQSFPARHRNWRPAHMRSGQHQILPEQLDGWTLQSKSVAAMQKFWSAAKS